jgi:hypothetical protein
MEEMPNETIKDTAWRHLIADADEGELIKRLGEIHDAIEYKRQIDYALRSGWVLGN